MADDFRPAANAARLEFFRSQALAAAAATPQWTVATGWARSVGLTYGELAALVAEVEALRERLACQAASIETLRAELDAEKRRHVDKLARDIWPEHAEPDHA